MTVLLHSRDIPQADNLERIIAVVEAVRDGSATVPAIRARLGVSPRHTNYTLQAARVLGLVEQTADGLGLTQRGTALLAANTATRLIYLRWVVARTEPMASLLRQIGDRAVPLDDLAATLAAMTALAPSTVRRRVQSMMRWLCHLNLVARGQHGYQQTEPPQLARGDPEVRAWLAACGMNDEDDPTWI